MTKANAKADAGTMTTLMLDQRAPLSADDVVTFYEKPNVILYSLEATRIVVLFILCLNVVQVLSLYFFKHVSLIFLVKLTLLIDGMLLLIFLVVVLLVATGLTFVATPTDVGIRFRPFGMEAWHLCVPIHDIKSVRVATYGPNYGSVYLDRRRETRARAPIDLIAAHGYRTAWLSLPWSWPPLIGFYGFRNSDQFARIILELNSHHLNHAMSR